MYAVVYLVSLLAGFFRPGITSVKIGPTAPAAIEQAGALVPNGAIVLLLTQLANNASPNFGNFSTTLIPASLSATTISGSQMPMGLIRRFSFTAATTDCTDTATNIVNAIPGAVPLQTFPMFYANLGSQPVTLAGGTGVTMAGTNVIGGFSLRMFLGQVTGSSAVTMTGLFAFGLQSGL